MAHRKNRAAVELGRLGGRARSKSIPEKMRKEIAAKAGKAAWDKMGPEERSAEMKRRAEVRVAKYAKVKRRKRSDGS
jgi:hypothetical protein